jgi:hypothetical protein
LKKNVSIILIICTILTFLVGCSSKSVNEVVNITTSSEVGEYVLTTDHGIITMFDHVGNIVSELDLGGGPESNYIYVMDQGNVYSSQLSNLKNAPQMLYAADKTTRKMTMVLVYNGQIKSMKDYILKESEIENIYAYNGLFFYSTNNQKTKANPYTYVRPQLLSDDGKLSYVTSIPVNTSKDSHFVYMENYSEDYLNFTGLGKKLSEIDKELLNIPKIDKATFELPGNINTWLANNKFIYFFTDTQMGQYDMLNNQITLHYGAIRPITSTYIDGVNKNIYTINDFGEDSKKTLLLNIDYEKMLVNKAIEINYNNALSLHVDKESNIYILFKNTYSDKNFSQLRVFKYGDYSEQYTIGVPYLPTKILSRKDMVYLFNPYEDYFLIGSIGSSDFSEVEKSPNNKDIKYTDIFLANKPYVNDYYYDEQGRLVNRHNILINQDGELINENNDRINIYGQRIDEKGRAINKDGQFIDKYNNILDSNGNIIKYVADKDGYYYNSKGQYVSENGVVLVRNEIGDWVLPEEFLEEQGGLKIKGHYDEHGNFIINRELLEKYPDAYDIWHKQRELKEQEKNK